MKKAQLNAPTTKPPHPRAGEVVPSDLPPAKIHRAAFVPRFGRPTPKGPDADLDPEELDRRRRYISERTPDPRKARRQ